jgi:hypothetical protein
VVIRSRKLWKDRQYNGQMKKDRQYNGQMKKDRQYNGQMKKDRRLILSWISVCVSRILSQDHLINETTYQFRYKTLSYSANKDKLYGSHYLVGSIFFIYLWFWGGSVSCVVCVSGLSILDWPFSFLYHVFIAVSRIAFTQGSSNITYVIFNKGCIHLL